MRIKKSGEKSVNYTLKSKIQTGTYERILVIRTDRIGDVILSTPVIKNLRDNFPQSFIAMMVRPYTKDIVEGNSYLDEVIIYDKEKKDKFLLGSLKFIFFLRRYKFDLAIILNPSNRAHLISFLAGIKRRLGYREKMGFLNTDKIEGKKYLGSKHEVDYNLDFLSLLGIDANDRSPYIPIKKEAEDKANLFLLQQGIKDDKLIIIHPGASCPSKIWPIRNFAQVADTLISRHDNKILIVLDKKYASLAEELSGYMEMEPILAIGVFSLSELAAVLKRAKLFISNDSGPVHIASAVGTPVISIFGRKQPGLGPKRWGPLGKNDIALQKDIGCSVCLAHNCKIGFACLKAITPDDVLEAAKKISVLK